MTDLRKAAEMALEALERMKQYGNVFLCRSHDQNPYDQVCDAITELRQALAQPEEKMRIEGDGKLTTKPYPDGYESEQEFKEAIRKASAQPEQRPVAGMFEEKLPDQNPPPWVRDYKAKE